MEKKEREKEIQHDEIEGVKEDEWKIGRKRKAGREKVGGLGIKLRKTSTADSRDAESVSNDTGISESKGSRKEHEPETKADGFSLDDGEAKADEAPASRDTKDESICAGNLKEDALRGATSATKSAAKLVSYGSDEDDEW